MFSLDCLPECSDFLWQARSQFSFLKKVLDDNNKSSLVIVVSTGTPHLVIDAFHCTDVKQLLC